MLFITESFLLKSSVEKIRGMPDGKTLFETRSLKKSSQASGGEVPRLFFIWNFLEAFIQISFFQARN